MQIYFSPELIQEDKQILNIVDQNGKPVGFLTCLSNDKKMYIYGNVEEEGITEDFKDLAKPYIQGIAKNKSDIEIYSYFSAGGKKLEFEKDVEKK